MHRNLCPREMVTELYYFASTISNKLDVGIKNLIWGKTQFTVWGKPNSQYEKIQLRCICH